MDIDLADQASHRTELIDYRLNHATSCANKR
jgi:hypothetical protein